MSDALPRNIDLASQKPYAVPSYLRRFRNIQTNASGNNLENSEIIIPIDTGTPGAFLDCSASYLQFTLDIVNNNPYADYTDFGLAGGNSFFKIMQIRNNGTGIETIRDYNTVFENWMAIEGLGQAEFKMYTERTNDLGDGQMKMHINSCKAPMVDTLGRIMQSYSNYNTATDSVGYFPIQGFNSSNYDNQGNLNSNSQTCTNIFLKQGIASIDRTGTSNINMWPYSIGIEPQNNDWKNKSNLRFQDYMAFLSNVKNIPIGCTSRVTPGSDGVRLFTASPLLPNGTGTSRPTDPGLFSYTFCVPVLSGLLGVMAEKMAPTMLLDNFQLVMTTTNYAEPFKLTMDPCRILGGTHRDYLVYYGNDLGGMTSGGGSLNANTALPWIVNYQRLINQFNGPVIDENQQTIMLSTGTNNYATYNAMAYNAGLASVDVSTINPISAVMSGGGTPEVPANMISNGIIVDQSGGNTTPFSAENIAAAMISYSTICANPLQVTTVVNYNYDLAAGGTNNLNAASFPGGGMAINAAPNFHDAYTYFGANTCVPQYYQPLFGYADNAAPNSAYGPIFTNTIQVGNDLCGCYGTYLKSSTPQTQRVIQNGIQSVQLNFATPPIFSTWKYTKQGSSFMPTWSIRNVYFVATQVIIPDEITAQILASASRGDISIQTSTIQVYSNIALTPNSSSQNIIIPAKVGSANTLFGIFRMNEQTSNTQKQYLYNSFRGICPIGYKLFQPTTGLAIGTNVTPATQYVTAGGGSSNAFSFQLKIGNDLVPAQPMSSPTELIVELEKCTHGLNERWNNMSFGNSIINTPSAFNTQGDLVYDILTPGGYFTTWVDPFYLADQTIINNSMLQYTTGIISQGPTADDGLNQWNPVAIGNYLVEQFKHPDGGFLLGIDLDTWSGFSNVAMSGRYLGSNTVSLACEGLNLVGALGANAQTATVNFTAFIMCDARWSFQAGGNSQVFV